MLMGDLPILDDILEVLASGRYAGSSQD